MQKIKIKTKEVFIQESAAEVLPFEDNSVEVVYVNMAIHWFNRDLFFTEVKVYIKKRDSVEVVLISVFKLKLKSILIV